MVIIVIIGMLFVIWLAVAAVPITATTAFAVGEQFTEQEKSDIRQHIPDIVQQCQIAKWVNSPQCKALLGFLAQDCQKFVNIWEGCGRP
jgi:hypothetical protein